MNTLAQAALWALALPAVLMCLYLLWMTLASAKQPAPRSSSKSLRFDVIVPAHDEAAVIEMVVRSVLQLDWPRDGFHLIVVADNCTDNTASLARAAGATVMARSDTQHRGKGFALASAFEFSHLRQWADAVVVVDADTEVSPNLLEAFACRIECGASAIQAHYGVLNAQSSWRTRLMTIAMTCFHRVRSRARERAALSCGFRGNGWCVTHTLLQQVPYCAYSLAEDVEYGIALGMKGYRVHYADEAQVLGLMVSGSQAAATQRRRWEIGRRELIRSKIRPLLQRAMRHADRVCTDLALDLLMPPLSTVALNVAILILAAAVSMFFNARVGVQAWIAVVCAASLIAYVLRGWRLSGIGPRGALDLLRAPIFIVWKLLLAARTPRVAAWVRTKREQS